MEADLSRVSDRENSLTDFACGTEALSRETHPHALEPEESFIGPVPRAAKVGLYDRDLPPRILQAGRRCSYVAERKPPHGSPSASLRVFMLDYFRNSSTEDGHMCAGHCQSMFMSQQEDRWLMRDIRTRRTTSFRTD